MSTAKARKSFLDDLADAALAEREAEEARAKAVDTMLAERQQKIANLRERAEGLSRKRLEALRTAREHAEAMTAAMAEAKGYGHEEAGILACLGTPDTSLSGQAFDLHLAKSLATSLRPLVGTVKTRLGGAGGLMLPHHTAMYSAWEGK